MNNSDQKNESDQNYPDIMTFPIERFRYTIIPSEITVNEFVRTKFPIYLFSVYGTVDYDDLVLWLNNKTKPDLVVGEKLLIPDKRDLDNFYLKFTKTF